MNPEQFIEVLREERASAILRTSSQSAAAKAMDAAIRGGFRIVEFTLTIPGAFELIQDFSKRSGVLVGAGTVLNVADARKSVECGACFLVSPVTDTSVIAEARELNVASLPGTHTPTEMWQAYSAGAPLQKLFPAPAGGPAYVRACLLPMPFLRIVPTNGIDESNASEYLRAGAFGLGFTASLFDADEIKNERFARIEERAKLLLKAARS